MVAVVSGRRARCYRIVKIRAGQAWRVTSGEDLPQAASW